MPLRTKCICCEEWIEDLFFAFELKPGLYVHLECYAYLPVHLYLDKYEQEQYAKISCII